jgi:hypothetical protein
MSRVLTEDEQSRVAAEIAAALQHDWKIESDRRRSARLFPFRQEENGLSHGNSR